MTTRTGTLNALLAVILAVSFSVIWQAQTLEAKNSIPLPPGTLTAKEILDLFSNTTVYSVTAVKGRKSISYYSSNGEVRQQRDNRRRTGQWRVTKSDRMCIRMEELPEKCRIIVKENGGYSKYVVKKNGIHLQTIRYSAFVKGNPLGL